MRAISIQETVAYWAELEKIAREGHWRRLRPGQEGEGKSGQPVLGRTWVGASGAAALAGGVALQRGGQISTSHTREAPKEVVIYYTDPRRGAGHEAQGKAVLRKLKAMGVKARLVDFDNRYVDPEVLKSYNETFNRYRGSKDKGLSKKLPYLADYVRAYTTLDTDKLRKDMNRPGVLPVFANPQLQWSAQRAGVTHGVSMHTDQAPWSSMDAQGRFGGRRSSHIVTESAAEEFFKQHPTLNVRSTVVSDLAIADPPDPSKKMVDAISGKEIKMDGAYNITVSGGAQGWDTDKITQNLIGADLPDGTVIHVVTGGDKLPDGKKVNTAVFPSAEAVKSRPGVEIRVYGWAPLRQMMDKAELNVLRPHGTSITEATAAGKPFVMAVPDSPLDMELNDAKAASKHVGQPAAPLSGLRDAVNDVLKNYGKFSKAVQEKAPQARGAAQEWAEALAHKRTVRAFPLAGRGVAVAGMSAILLGGGALASHLAFNYVEKREKGEMQIRWKDVSESKPLLVGGTAISSALMVLGIAAARRGSTLRALEKHAPLVTAKSAQQFQGMLKPGDLLMNQINPGKGAWHRTVYKVMTKHQGEMSHISVYLGKGEIMDVTPGGTYRGRVRTLADSYLKDGERSMIVIRPDGDGQRIAKNARKMTKDFIYNMGMAERIGLSELLPEFVQKYLFREVDSAKVICTTATAEVLAQSGVKLPKAPGRMLALDFRKMGTPPIIKFQGTRDEAVTSPYQGAGFLIPGLVLGGATGRQYLKRRKQSRSD
jgi:hypothetical protein